MASSRLLPSPGSISPKTILTPLRHKFKRAHRTNEQTPHSANTAGTSAAPSSGVSWWQPMARSRRSQIPGAWNPRTGPQVWVSPPTSRERGLLSGCGPASISLQPQGPGSPTPQPHPETASALTTAPQRSRVHSAPSIGPGRRREEGTWRGPPHLWAAAWGAVQAPEPVGEVRFSPGSCSSP